MKGSVSLTFYFSKNQAQIAARTATVAPGQTVQIDDRFEMFDPEIIDQFCNWESSH